MSNTYRVESVDVFFYLLSTQKYVEGIRVFIAHNSVKQLGRNGVATVSSSECQEHFSKLLCWKARRRLRFAPNTVR